MARLKARMVELVVAAAIGMSRNPWSAICPKDITNCTDPTASTRTHAILLLGVRESLVVVVRPPAVLGFTSSTAPAAAASLAKAARRGRHRLHHMLYTIYMCVCKLQRTHSA